jgi:hypothetical protein
MTSIHLPKTDKNSATIKRDIESCLGYIDFKEYRSMPGYYIIQVKPRILRYMTEHLFDKQEDAENYRPTSVVSEEVFNDALERAKTRVEGRNSLLRTLREYGEKIEALLGKDSIKQYSEKSREYHDSIHRGEDCIGAIRIISSICSHQDFSYDKTRKAALETASTFFESTCRYFFELIMKRGITVSDPTDQELVRVLTERLEENHKWLSDVKRAIENGREQAEANDKDEDELIIEQLWEIFGEKEFEEQFTSEITIPDIEYMCDQTRAFISETEAELHSAMKPGSLSGNDLIRSIIKHMGRSYAQKFETEEEGEDFYVKLSRDLASIQDVATNDYKEITKQRNSFIELLGKFGVFEKEASEEFLNKLIKVLGDDSLGAFAEICYCVRFISSELKKDIHNIEISESYKKATMREGVTAFADMKEYDKEKYVMERAVIEFFHELMPLSTETPDLSETVYTGSRKRDFPSLEDIVILQEINNMIVADTIVSKKGVGSSSGIHYATTTVSRETQLVGFLYNPQFMIPTQARGSGQTVDATMYNGEPGSLPSLNGNVSDYLEHSTAVRDRRRGRVFCIFYVGSEPYAANEENIYPLDRKFEGECLDIYTQEALLYAWDLSKVNVQNTIADVKFLKSTHSPYTYLTVSVRRPDDVFYDKLTEIPYDVLILQSNIKPPLLPDKRLVHAPETKRENPKGGGFQGERGITVEFNDRVWMRKFHRCHTLEVFDKKTMSDVIYCSKMNYDIEIITRPSLRIHDVRTRLRLLAEGDIMFNQYTLPRETNHPSLDRLREQMANPFLNHYMRGPVSKFGDQGPEIVKQALKGIAYTLFCKLVNGFCDKELYDLTKVINDYKSTLHKRRFTRMVTKRISEEKPGETKVIAQKDIVQTDTKSGKNTLYGLTIPCTVSRVEDGMLHLWPVREGIRRTISTRDPKETKEYYTLLINLTGGIINFQFSSAVLSDEDYEKGKAIIDKLSSDNTILSEKLKAQVLKRVITGAGAPPDQEQARIFADKFKDEEKKYKRTATVPTPNIKTSYGLTSEIISNTLKVTDTIHRKHEETPEATFELPIKIKATMIDFRASVEEKMIDEPFVGSMDMTFLTLLDYELYQGTNKLLNGLFSIYHCYNSSPPKFSPDELGSFLWSELIEKNWDIPTLRRVYSLISYQPKNLVLRTTERVITKDDNYGGKPVMIYRLNLNLKSVQ